MENESFVRRNNSGIAKAQNTLTVKEIDEFGDFYCPRCYSLLDGVGQNTCRHCHQKLDWHDWENASELPYEKAAKRCLNYTKSK